MIDTLHVWASTYLILGAGGEEERLWTLIRHRLLANADSIDGCLMLFLATERDRNVEFLSESFYRAVLPSVRARIETSRS